MHSAALLSDIAKLPKDVALQTVYRLLRRHGIYSNHPLPAFPQLSDKALRRLEVAHRHSWTCSLCTRPCSATKGTIDHHVPLSKGGSELAVNLRWAHDSCNRAKGDTMPTTGVFPACFREGFGPRAEPRAETEKHLDDLMLAAEPPARTHAVALEIKLQVAIAADGAISVNMPSATPAAVA